MSDCAVILSILRTGRSLTSYQAFVEIGCTRLAARIHDLRRQGHVFETVMQETTDDSGETTRYAKYYYRGFNGYNGKGA